MSSHFPYRLIAGFLARECLSKMADMDIPLSPARKAKVDYLRLRLFHAEPQ